MSGFKSMFRKLNSNELVVIELETARKALGEAQTGFEYASAMVKYNTERVARLESKVEAARAGLEKEKNTTIDIVLQPPPAWPRLRGIVKAGIPHPVPQLSSVQI